ncbi:MAG: hypothetical protein FJ146_15255 [Deltaproteobacteria bacterium]|nr:hypothetical protein [Deltaproteobacteria bacterium]
MRFQFAIARVFAVSMALSFGITDSARAAAPQTYTSFSELRSEVLNIIGGTARRLWLTTEYLTDGEIVTALYVAQYRKVDVRILLGRAKASSYMSRLNYLKNQNIPVFLRPDNFKPKSVSTILSDDKLVEIDGELDFMSKYKKFNLTVAEPAVAQEYAATFGAAAAQQLPASQRPMPLVGKQKTPWPTTDTSPPQPAVKSRLPVVGDRTVREVGVDDGDTYIYTRRAMPRPDGVPIKLPKELKWQQQRPARSHTPSPEPAPITLPQTQPPAARTRAPEFEPPPGNYFDSKNTGAPAQVQPMVGGEDTKLPSDIGTKRSSQLLEDSVQGGE